LLTRSSGTPPTLSTNRPPPDLGKWGRPQGLSQRPSDVGSLSPSRTSPASRHRRTRGPAGDDSESRRNRPLENFRMTSTNDTKWKRLTPFPMLPAGSKRSPRSLPRDPAPHLSDSAIHPFPSPSTAARPRRTTYELNRHAESIRSTSEDFTDEGTFEPEVSYSDHACELPKQSKARRLRAMHKERGSLRRTFRDDDLPSRNSSRNAPTKVLPLNSRPKNKPRALNETKVEVFIPSIVSVGNLSRILGVSLSRRCLRFTEKFRTLMNIVLNR
jgi:hypothetical protein